MRLQPLGSVGKPIGPSIEIQGGEVMLRGPLVMHGYWGDDNGWSSGLFATGDLGHLDENGFLWLTGRKKEVINQGGETIAPQEIEETVIAHPDVKEVAAYPVSHERLGEAVALAVCLEDQGYSKLSGDKIKALELQSLAEDIASSLAVGRRPAVIAFVSSLSRTSTGKVQRLKNPWCCQGSSHELKIVTAAERHIIVLDARECDSKVQPSPKRITAEAGTFVSILEQETNSKNIDTEEKYDSLGMLQSVSAKENFEMTLVSQMYVFGMLGITIEHMLQFANVPFFTQFHYGHHRSEQGMSMELMLRSMVRPWHLLQFFVCAGYLDSLYMPEFGGRDLAMFLLVSLLPLADNLQIFPDDWMMIHPLRWFFTSMLFNRVYAILGRRFSIPKWVLVVVVPFYTCTWEFLLLSSQGLTVGYNILHNIFISLGRVDKACVSAKQNNAGVAYLLAFLFLPDFVRAAGKLGPRTKHRERILGLVLYLVFICSVVQESYTQVHSYTANDYHLIVSDGRIEIEPYDMPTRCSGAPGSMVPVWELCIPLKIFSGIAQTCVLAAALTYCPLNLPDVYLNASFGALLLIQLPFTEAFQNVSGIALFGSQLPAAFRWCMFFGVFSVYFAIASPIFQIAVARSVTVAVRLGTKCWLMTKLEQSD